MNNDLLVVAGPCSVDGKNVAEIKEIANIEIDGRKAIAGVRVVGLKSRTAYESSGEGMGLDYDALANNMAILQKGGSVNDFVDYPSVKIAKEIADSTGTMIASEIMLPHLQLPVFERILSESKFLAWSPSVNQLGWPLLEMGSYTKKNNWLVGIKNGKWIGTNINSVDDAPAPIEKVWQGLASYVNDKNQTILIHRGFDIAEKGDFRNLPIHAIAKRVKAKSGCRMFFDPSHTFGPKLRDEIVNATIEAMRMKANDQYLYDGVLIEAGTSQTDTEQHITISELKDLVRELSKFRKLVSPDEI